MFNVNINFNKIMRDILLVDLRTPVRMKRVKAMLKPLKIMHAEFLVARKEALYKTTFNGQVIYLETALNDKFDPVNRAIFISSNFYNEVYIYRKSEARPAIKLYRKWNAGTAYTTGKFAWYDGDVYEANTNNTNKIPGIDPEWTLTTKKAPVLRKADNYNGQISFTVNVPVSLTFSMLEMQATINYYIFSGFGYDIVTF